MLWPLCFHNSSGLFGLLFDSKIIVYHLLTYPTLSSPTKKQQFLLFFSWFLYTILFATFSLCVKANMQKIRKHWTNVYTPSEHICCFLVYFSFVVATFVTFLCTQHTVKWLCQNWSNESVWQTRFINSTPHQHFKSTKHTHQLGDALNIAVLAHVCCLFSYLFLLWLLVLSFGSVGQLGRILCPLLIFIISLDTNLPYLQWANAENVPFYKWILQASIRSYTNQSLKLK